MIGADEDSMPLDGNPHPIPRENPPQPFWAMPPYPALGWNAVPPNHQPLQQGFNGWEPNVQQDEGYGAWEEQAQNQPVGNDQDAAQNEEEVE